MVYLEHIWHLAHKLRLFQVPGSDSSWDSPQSLVSHEPEMPHEKLFPQHLNPVQTQIQQHRVLYYIVKLTTSSFGFRENVGTVWFRVWAKVHIVFIFINFVTISCALTVSFPQLKKLPYSTKPSGFSGRNGFKLYPCNLTRWPNLLFALDFTYIFLCLSQLSMKQPFVCQRFFCSQCSHHTTWFSRIKYFGLNRYLLKRGLVQHFIKIRIKQKFKGQIKKKERKKRHLQDWKWTNCRKGTDEPCLVIFIRARPAPSAPRQEQNCTELTQLHKVQGNRKWGPCSQLCVRKPNSSEFTYFTAVCTLWGAWAQGNSPCTTLQAPLAGGFSPGALSITRHQDRKKSIWLREFIPARKWRRGPDGDA